MSVLLTGREGQVGHELARAFSEGGGLYATDRHELDLSQPDEIRRVTRALRPALILNAAAYTAVDRAEDEIYAALQANALAPALLAEEARRCGALLVHYSTDYVFDGSQRGMHAEHAPKRPLNVYGATKLAGEAAVAASGCRFLILRTSWVYSPRGRNFFIAIATRARAGGRLRVVYDQVGTPTEARFLAELTRTLVLQGAEGLFHAVPAGQTTWHGFAAAIVRELGVATEVEAISSSEYPTRARRPANSCLDTAHLCRALGTPLPQWDIFLHRCAQEWLSRGRPEAPAAQAWQPAG